MTFRNNFERDVWNCWYERFLCEEIDRHKNVPDGWSPDPVKAAEMADKILEQLQSRRQKED